MTMNDTSRMEVGGPGDLIGRVRRAHDAELDGPEPADDAEVDRPPLSDGLREAERRITSAIDGDLERGLVSTACEVVAGRYDSADAVREAVVDTVVEAKYDQLVVGDDRDAVVDTVHATLTGDATFRAEVESMLIHAARRLGRTQREQWRQGATTEPDEAP